MNAARLQHAIASLMDPRPEQGRDKISWLGALQVRDLMSAPAVCTDPSSALTAAHLLMREHNLRRLPVVENGRLVGILTLGDVRGAGPSEVSTLNRTELGYLTEQLKVERAMSREVVTTAPDSSLKEAARLMVQHRVSGLPVVSPAGELMGVVTESDIFKTMVDLLELDEQLAEPSAS